MVLDALFRPVKPRFFFDGDVEAQVRGLISEAREEITLVSPYNDFWIHLKDELRYALARGVKCLLVYRAGENKKDIRWLEEQGATVRSAERLHSKLYMNETTALVTSMNLVESSAINSKEICVSFDGPELENLVEYVRKLVGHSEANPAQETAHGDSKLSVSPKDARPPRNTPEAKTYVPSTTGHCIRCGQAGIAYDPEKTLCRKCFRSWNRHQNRDYPEKHCHRCGKQRKTSFATPLCTPCYKVAASTR